MVPFARGQSIAAAAASTLALATLLGGCGSGSSDNPAAIAVAPCSGATCGSASATTRPDPPTQLCPTSLDYSTTFTGGSGSGEYIRVKFDTSKKQYQMTFVESEVPTSSGQVNNTRAGMTITGDFVNANLYQLTDSNGHTSTPLTLPTAEQNRCAFVLKNGQTADGSYAITVNPQDPPVLYVGNGIVGGGIPGATIQFNGVPIIPGFNAGVVPSKTFDYYPFIAFTNTITDFSKVAGDYNELGIRFTPEGGLFQTTPDNPAPAPLGWQVDAIQTSQTFKADGSCAPDAAQAPNACVSTGGNWTLRTNTDGSPDNVFVSGTLPAPQPPSGPLYPAVGGGLLQQSYTPNAAHGLMIVGNLNGQAVPVIIRVGYAHAGADISTSTLDDQIGISLLSPVATVQPSAFKGAFIGANSVTACGLVTAYGPASGYSEGACLDQASTFNAGVNYTSTIFQSPSAAFMNPFTSTAATNFALDYTQTQPGVVQVTAENNFNSGSTAVFKSGDTGALIKAGSVFGLLMNGTNAPNPFFTIGAFVQ
ncbi:DUF2957 domain-containing protein [Trinickia fusca]|uniref:DUF2957 domain-containing protein n=1 Tax=Trinickia fusca TaxID=2419777 RepID=A0A494XCW6_9BURK|nr:DUF2957 domain-containing protein [Trinickia fusca]RKP46366.1 DUF2957 domain-containing protein [Trinickia fusca]